MAKQTVESLVRDLLKRDYDIKPKPSNQNTGLEQIRQVYDKYRWIINHLLGLAFSTVLGLTAYQSFVDAPKNLLRLESVMKSADVREANAQQAEKLNLAVVRHLLSQRVAQLAQQPPGDLKGGALLSTLREIEELKTLADDYAKYLYTGSKESTGNSGSLTASIATKKGAVAEQLCGLQVALYCIGAYYGAFLGSTAGRVECDILRQKLEEIEKAICVNDREANEIIDKQLRVASVPGMPNLVRYIAYFRGTLKIKCIQAAGEVDLSRRSDLIGAIALLELAASENANQGDVFFERATTNLAAAHLYRFRINTAPLFSRGEIDAESRDEASAAMLSAKRNLEAPEEMLDINSDPIGVSIRLANHAETLSQHTIVTANTVMREQLLDAADKLLSKAKSLKAFHPFVHVSEGLVQSVKLFHTQETLSPDMKRVAAEEVIRCFQRATRGGYKWEFPSALACIKTYSELNVAKAAYGEGFPDALAAAMGLVSTSTTK